MNQATPEMKQLLEKAIRDGYIVWNAYPFTGGSELLDTSLFRFSIQQPMEMDRKYGKKTTAAKITDVAGETIGVIPILQEYGIKLLHIGVNQASPKAETPQVFLWRDRASGSEIVVVYENNYGDANVVPGFNHILQFAFTGDNHGPQSPEAVKEIYAQLRKKYPNAVIKASTLNDYANEVWKFRSHLPVIDKEIGSTWIYSAGTDPVKYASLRALMRLRTNWLVEKKVDPNDSDFVRFSTWVLMLSEHTGGLDEKKHIDFDHFKVDELQQVVNTEGYQNMIQSWEDAREYIQKAIEALGDSPLAKEAKTVLAELVAVKPDLKGFKPFDLEKGLRTDYFSVQFNPVTGAVIFLSDADKRNIWADGSAPFGLFWYESYNEEDYRLWAKEGLILTALTRHWVFEDFCKPNIDNHGAVSAKNKPNVIISKTGLMDKLGRQVSPMDVVSKGGRHLHGVNPGIRFNNGLGSIFIESLDCPIVAPGGPVMFDKTGELPQLGKGWHFNLLNNKWGTNFRTWYDDDAIFRFVIKFN